MRHGHRQDGTPLASMHTIGGTQLIMNDQVARREPDDTSYNTLITLLRREIADLQNQLASERERANALEYELLKRIAAQPNNAGKPPSVFDEEFLVHWGLDVPDSVSKYVHESADAVVELPLWTPEPSAKERLRRWWHRLRPGNE